MITKIFIKDKSEKFYLIWNYYYKIDCNNLTVEDIII